jgi:hypothetical protein
LRDFKDKYSVYLNLADQPKKEIKNMTGTNLGEAYLSASKNPVTSCLTPILNPMTLVLSPRKPFKHLRSCYSHTRLDIFKKGWTAYVQ